MAEAPAGIAVVPATQADILQWAALRALLWPDASCEQHAHELRALFASGRRYAGLLAVDDNQAVGFAEVGLRSDYVNGCDTSPVGFLEGIWVTPARRNAGIGRQLVEAAAAWVVGVGCSEFASDALLENTASHAFHRALGFVATDRVVYFKKELK